MGAGRGGRKKCDKAMKKHLFSTAFQIRNKKIYIKKK